MRTKRRPTKRLNSSVPNLRRPSTTIFIQKEFTLSRLRSPTARSPRRSKNPFVFMQTSSLIPKPSKFRPSIPGVETYREANPAEVATPEQSRFYDPAYRPELRKMVDHVISVEGPIYFDLLVDRISRAHNFQRARHTIRDIIRSALGRGRYPHTQDDGQELIWPAGADTKTLSPWRAGGSRHHSQVPLVELAGLARHLLTVELNDEDLVRNIQEVVGLARLTTPTRERFLRAIEIARKSEAGHSDG